MERLNTHNTGNSAHTSKYKPWEVHFYMGFRSRSKAAEFEKYLKTHSGRAFAVKRFIE